MGGIPWMYFVPYESDLQSALDMLKEREFRAGRYNPVLRKLPFPVDPEGPAPGAAHASIDAARAAAAEDGTRSILDMNRVSDSPKQGPSLDDLIGKAMQQAHRRGDVVDLNVDPSVLFSAVKAICGVVTPVPRETLVDLYGTEKPTREAVEGDHQFLEAVERGTGVYVVLYDGDSPREICFAGYSYD
jgi:hypothetical protein